MEFLEEYIIQAYQAMTLLELTGVIFGIVYIYFAANNSIWCWPAALISVSIFIYICIDVKLYAEALLQVYYWLMAIYGWYMWKGKEGDNDAPIITYPFKIHLAIIINGLLLTVLVYYLLSQFTDAAMPLLDSFTTVFSLLTTYLVTRKVLSNWLYWLVIDAVAVYLYASRELYLTAMLYMAYVIIVIFGYMKWKKILRQQNA